MKTIQLAQILNIYNSYGLSGKDSNVVRSEINTGFLDRTLNSGASVRNNFNMGLLVSNITDNRVSNIIHS